MLHIIIERSDLSVSAEISFHEKMFFTAIAMILGLLGWAANNYLLEKLEDE